MDMTSRRGPHIIKPRPIAPFRDRFAISGGAIRSFIEFFLHSYLASLSKAEGVVIGDVGISTSALFTLKST